MEANQEKKKETQRRVEQHISRARRLSDKKKSNAALSPSPVRPEAPPPSIHANRAVVPPRSPIVKRVNQKAVEKTLEKEEEKTLLDEKSTIKEQYRHGLLTLEEVEEAVGPLEAEWILNEGILLYFRIH